MLIALHLRPAARRFPTAFPDPRGRRVLDFFNLLRREWRMNFGKGLRPEHGHFGLEPGRRQGLLANGAFIEFFFEAGLKYVFARVPELLFEAPVLFALSFHRLPQGRPLLLGENSRQTAIER